MRHRFFLVLGWTLLFGFLAYTTAYAAEKVGYINLQRLVSESKMGKDARQDIQKLGEQKDKIVKAKLEEVNNLKEYLIQNRDKMDDREKRDKTEDLRRVYNDYQRLFNDAKEDLLKEDREIVSIILKRADDVLKKVAKSKNFAIILKDPNAIGYLDPEVDITDDVLKELNKKK